MNSIIYYMWIKLENKLAVRKTLKLVDYFGSIRAVYEADEKEYRECEMLSEAEIRALMDKNLKTVEAEIELCKSCRVKLLDCESKYYPRMLLEIPDPPLYLYLRGNVNVLNTPSICIVGARKPSVYGVNVASALSEDLADASFTIVSGLAHGIDSAAHKGALLSRGKTIGVMGCGIDVDYPKESAKIKEEIIEKGGAIISELPLGSEPLPQNFPVRNRILSGLSLATIVVEAAANSGSLITANAAIEQGRDVFAVPGNITSRLSVGTNALIKDGVTPILSSGDILDQFYERYSDVFSVPDEEEEEIQIIERKPTIKIKTDNEILAFLDDEPKDIDELSIISGISVDRLTGVLTLLELSGKVTCLPGRQYILKK